LFRNDYFDHGKIDSKFIEELIDKRNGDGFGTFRTYLRICIKWDQNIAKISI